MGKADVLGLGESNFSRILLRGNLLNDLEAHVDLSSEVGCECALKQIYHEYFKPVSIHC